MAVSKWIKKTGKNNTSGVNIVYRFIGQYKSFTSIKSCWKVIYFQKTSITLFRNVTLTAYVQIMNATSLLSYSERDTGDASWNMIITMIFKKIKKKN